MTEPTTDTAPAGVKETGRGRSSGRRQRDRDKQKTSAPHYITRKIPFYDMLSAEGLDRLERQAEWILKEVGIDFRGDSEALRLWREAGADVRGENVRFEPGLVRSVIQKTAPRQFTQLARNPARSVPIGGDHVVFAPAYGSPFVSDLTAGRRYGSLVDFENFIKLTYMCPWLHHSGGTVCEPVDVPVNQRHLDMVYAHLRYSDKPLMGSVTLPERAEESIEMCRVVFGAETVDKNCVILGNINVNSPLVYDHVMSGALRAYAAANQAAVVVPFILGGAMGPVTTAGAIAQAHAEAMVGVALTQLVRPGAPVIYGNFLSSMSLKSGAPTFGMPEPAIAYLAVGQLARRLGVPLRCGGALTASKAVDAQSAQESADSLMPALLCGANFILHAAGWLEGGLVMSYEKFMVDCDHLGMMHTFMNGLDLSENGLAASAFGDTGPGQHFLGTGHTLANYETAYYMPELSDSESYERWLELGEKRVDQRANEQYQRWLKSYEAPAIDPGVDEALKAYVTGRKASRADAWY
jgi:trimethylamine--corrinoid protein Co-methyltransferase